MQPILGTVCRTANKISLHMDYVATAKDPSKTYDLVLSSIDSSRSLLSLIDADDLRFWVEHLTTLFDQGTKPTPLDYGDWSLFVGRECDRLHQMGLHEKSIKNLGSLLSEWNFKSQTYTKLADSLDTLNDLESNAPHDLAVYLQTIDHAPEEMTNASSFALVHNSLASIFGGISFAKSLPGERPVDAAATVSFGCGLLNECLVVIKKRCDSRTLSHRIRQDSA